MGIVIDKAIKKDPNILTLALKDSLFKDKKKEKRKDKLKTIKGVVEQYLLHDEITKISMAIGMDKIGTQNVQVHENNNKLNKVEKNY